ncbi:MAG: hypothetical protein A2V93_05495 [Ignavibacteria bacterium RBG_16_34_14]|nr:MAG: hypothetical protein A2V93_05495 [Ignavibacteria bacterium RBG_16_34_14]
MIKNIHTKCIIIVFANLILALHSSAQTEISISEETAISGGAEYAIYIQNIINSGNQRMLEFNGIIPQTDIVTTYDGISFDEDASNSGFYHIPPDPIGAAGPAHLVSVVNTSIEWFTKAGVMENSQRLGKNSTTHAGSFFESLTPTTGTFDPKVIYDQYAGRFLVVSLERVGTINDAVGNISRILLAVSDDSNPNGTWYFQAVDSKLTITSGDGTHDSWADYPGFAVDEEAIYVTANMFRFSGGSSLDSRVWIIAKTPFYIGGSATVSIFDHGALAGLGDPYPTTQPAHMFGTPSSSTLGTFLVSSGWTSGSTDFLSVIRIDNPLSSPTFTNIYLSLGDIHSGVAFSDAPQSGTSTLIETNDMRTLNAVWRNDNLWVANCIIPPSGTDAGQVTAHWYKIGTSASITLADQGNVGGESIATGCYTFFPAISVNSSNDVVIGFSASASSIYPGCYFTGRLSGDPAAYTTTPGVVKAGLDYYKRMFGGTRNRWGDYSGASVDPSDDQTFYIFNEYALTRGTILPSFPTEDGRWGTAFVVVPVSELPVELSSFTAIYNEDWILLEWTTQTEVNNYGFEIERLVRKFGLGSGEPEVSKEWKKVGFVQGYGNSNSPKEYSFIDKDIIAGSYLYRLKQFDTDGSYEYSNVIEAEVKIELNDFKLGQNYPNPFNPSTKIEFIISSQQLVVLKVYDVLGNEIATLVNEIKQPGTYEVKFNANNFSSGIYFYSIIADKFVQTREMVFLR